MRFKRNAIVTFTDQYGLTTPTDATTYSVRFNPLGGRLLKSKSRREGCLRLLFLILIGWLESIQYDHMINHPLISGVRVKNTDARSRLNRG